MSRIVDGNADIWTKQLPDGPFERLTFDSDSEMSPGWSPEGQYVVYSRGSTNTALSPWQSRADGTGVPQRLLGTPTVGGMIQGRWSVDGEWMVFRQGADIVGFRPGADSTTVPLVATPFTELGPALSPDGRWLAYSSDESGREEVYVRPFPDVDSGRVPISTGGGSNLRWANSGTELFFVDADRRMNAA